MNDEHSHTDKLSDQVPVESRITIVTNQALFALGAVVATPAALAALEKTGFQPVDILARHISGDWGDCSSDDARSNDLAVKSSQRIFSVYRLLDAIQLEAMSRELRQRQATLWVITEWDRSVTTLLLPYEY